ncbi:alcohol dehydrogenase yqhd [Anaeramoeba flamelloides]|uniref:Alcohol dehydrogenase yqhd n=1 Tax=Anaeramoeba flamelloides TaxID=1746091 RepID=A0AAV7ZCQ5_9EUKA|nr:alcohol dehydrogenase yqhd [Anaeramoeba flamelloides]KAJ6240170.1 alcohol dehydrogenase yqhd [Anaeramoeba flamelloides]
MLKGMNNFVYYNPTRIFFGKNTIIPNLKTLIPKKSNILVTYGGGSIFRNGVFDQVTKGLGEGGHKIFEYGGITPNPRYKHAMEAVDICRKKNIDFLLSVGGGSVLDLTKFISLSSKYEGNDPWDLIAKIGSPEVKVPKSVIPIGDVLTLPATGSEANCGFVVTRETPKGNIKIGARYESVFPKFSILDPETTYSLPWKQTVNGIVDAFVHCVEFYMNADDGHPLPDRYTEGVMETLIDASYRVKKNKKDYVARADIFWASTLALNGMSGCGIYEPDGVTHHIGHEITALTEADHGLTLACVLPGVWRHQFEYKKEKLAMFAERVWKIRSGNVEQKARKAIDCTIKWLNDIGMPTRLSACGKILPSNYRAMGEHAVGFWSKVMGTKGIGQKRNVGVKEIIEILELCDK